MRLHDLQTVLDDQARSMERRVARFVLGRGVVGRESNQIHNTLNDRVARHVDSLVGVVCLFEWAASA
jgi:hypothetical protein